MKVIGINGFKRSGKGTVAQFLSQEHEGVVYEIGFADKVKILGAFGLGFDRPPREQIALMDRAKELWTIRVTEPVIADGEAGAELDPGVEIHYTTGRSYLQEVGTRARELFGSDFWVDQVLPCPAPPTYSGYEQAKVDADQRALEARYPDIDVVAITDLRFENEAQRVLNLGGEIWRVNRPGVGSDGHASEQPLPDDLVTVEIDNSGDLNDLRDEVRKAMTVR
jgi:hypothetical protein